ncbi:arsenical pump membrane protein-domain-containing protein [Jimgerdemannia flammicorona]|uniref:Arsenical pump membrane protein-domain-containing protein n=1 Tax=Jimgerdemannia flammicorona TaxID=994334 RepID=A0A433DJ06_9FUNG|nr:arsenical pump membrane protein-domain-containing protein [Jimgerdemannia flammicorona]
MAHTLWTVMSRDLTTQHNNNPTQSDPALTSRPLDISSWLSLVTFLLVITFVIYPVKIPLLLLRRHRIHLTFDLATAPILGICFLLAANAIPPAVVRDGFLGSQGIEPYSIMALFYALAYICISLDLTGVFQYCAFWVSKRAGSRGQALFTSFFVLTTLMSGLASNDVVILTGTAFLVYFTRVADINPPTAFLMSEFVSANIASMALYIGNPTNVVVSQAYNISFLEYSAWMILPTLVSILLAYLVLRLLFRSQNYVPRTISAPDSDPRTVLIDPWGAVFGLVVLAFTLATLIGTSFADVPVWAVTLPYAIIMLARDVGRDLWTGGAVVWRRRRESRIVEQGLDVGQRWEAMPEARVVGFGEDGALGRVHSDVESIVSEAVTVIGNEHLKNPDEWMTKEAVKGAKLRRFRTEPLATTSQPLPSPIPSSPRTEERDMGTIPLHPMPESPLPTPEVFTPNPTPTPIALARRLPTLHAALARMPWKILPFALGMFVLVEALASVGWTAVFATGLAACIPNPFAAVFAMCFISILLCNLLNNLPMTILVARVLQHPNFYAAPQVTPMVMRGVLFALVIGSNLGACLTIMGSLAGIMWDHILKTKGVGGLGYLAFLRWNLAITPVVAGGACAVLLAELYIVYR